MTPIQSILAAPKPAASTARLPLPQSILVRWASQAGTGSEDLKHFVLEIEPIGHDHAHVLAWVEQGSSRRTVLDRQAFRIAACAEHGMLHVDVFGSNGDGRIAAISLGHDGERAVRPLYARTTLLARGGFAAGAYDPPMFTI